MMKKQRLSCLIIILMIGLIGCSGKATEENNSYNFPDNNGGLTLPDGFSAMIVAKNLGPARHIAVAEDGDIYVSLQSKKMAAGWWPSAIPTATVKQMSENISAIMPIRVFNFGTATYTSARPQLFTGMK